MSLTVWKYYLGTRYSTFDMPTGAKPLTVAMQGERTCLWCLVDEDAMKVPRTFIAYGTGHEIRESADKLAYVGTFQFEGGALIFHVFEVLP